MVLQFQININDQIPKYLQSESRLVTTQCIIVEAEALGAKVQGAVGIVKQFLVYKCGHEKSPRSGAACIKSMVSSQITRTLFIQNSGRKLILLRKPKTYATSL